MEKPSKKDYEDAIKILKAEREKHLKFITVIETNIIGLKEEILKLEEEKRQEKSKFNGQDDDYQ